jgi:hypoxanthine phosphoribosyltransferase
MEIKNDDPKLGQIIVSKQQLKERVATLGAQISRDYAGKDILCIGILRGSFIFLADLVRAVSLPVEIDFMAVSSYGSATKTKGEVRIVKDISSSLNNRHVIVVEDIIDSGVTLAFLQKTLGAHNPASLEICSLLVRKSFKSVNVKIKYVGFYIPDDFVVGYGLDAKHQFRNLPEIRAYKDA